MNNLFVQRKILHGVLLLLGGDYKLSVLISCKCETKMCWTI